MPVRVSTIALPAAVLVYAGLAGVLYPATFFAMVEFYIRQASILPVVLFVGLPILAVLLRPKAPLQLVGEILRSGALRLLLVTALFSIGMAGFTTFKLAIPDLVPFYADSWFADIDAWLHRGNPGEWAHAIVPSWAQYPLGYLYGPIWFLLWFGLLTMVCLHPDQDLRQRYFWSMALAVGLIGTLCAMAFSSVGPIFYAEFVEPERFATLLAAIEKSAIGDYMQQASDYLLASYHAETGAAGTGISAMPSMHLAIVTLNAWMLSSLNRYLGYLAWIYVGLIQLGSVFLGWHYAIDGYFSILAVSMIWFAVGRVLARSSRHKPVLIALHPSPVVPAE